MQFALGLLFNKEFDLPKEKVWCEMCNVCADRYNRVLGVVFMFRGWVSYGRVDWWCQHHLCEAISRQVDD